MTLQAVVAPGAPLPWLSYGALLALIAGAVGYGRVMQTVKSSSDELKSFKRENDARLLRIESQVGEVAAGVARIDERTRPARHRSTP